MIDTIAGTQSAMCWETLANSDSLERNLITYTTETFDFPTEVAITAQWEVICEKSRQTGDGVIEGRGTDGLQSRQERGGVDSGA